MAEPRVDHDPASSEFRWVAPVGTCLVEASAGPRHDRAPHASNAGTLRLGFGPGEPQRIDLSLERILRLLEPFDNTGRLPARDETPTHASPVRFAWEPLPEATTYRYTLLRVDAERLVAEVSSETAGTAVTLELPPGRYEFRLSADGVGGRVGRLEVCGEGSRAWGYRFAVP